MSKRKEVTVNGINISYLDNEINGKVVVLVHGNSGSAEVFCRQFEDKQISGEYRMVALDLPGHGQSDHLTDPANYNIGYLSDIVSGFIAETGLENVVLAGHSLGGHIALEAVPKLKGLAGVVVWGTPALTMPPQMDKMFLPHPGMAVLLKEEYTREEFDLLIEACGLNEADAGLVLDDFEKTDAKFRGALPASLARPETYCDESDIIRSAAFPVAVIHGERDPFVSLDYIQSLGLDLWKGNVQSVSGSGHYPQMDNAGEFNEVLKDFLAVCSK